uniref:Kinesin motor domain-containing protein n=1 Tax=Echinostoma caproni TaxID=27848 RepID=A0A183A9Y3_9TREM
LFSSAADFDPINSSALSQKQQHLFKSLRTAFADAIHHQPPPAPPTLFKQPPPGSHTEGKDDLAFDKVFPIYSTQVKVVLHVHPSVKSSGSETPPCLTVDRRRKQVGLIDPNLSQTISATQRRAGVGAPKFFSLDAVFTEEDSLAELCSFALTDIVQAVVNGCDGCLISLGSGNSYKPHISTAATTTTTTTATITTMIGEDKRGPIGFGLLPCAIAWLFRLISEQKERTGARFSVRVSAVELVGEDESLRDLLTSAAQASDAAGANAPSVYLREDPISGMQLENQSELRAPTAEKAAFFLDCALAAQTHQTCPEISSADIDESGPGESEQSVPRAEVPSHLFFTLHVYQYRVEKSGCGSGVAGGRSRLHLIDLHNSRLGKEQNVTVDDAPQTADDHGPVAGKPEVQDTQAIPRQTTTNALTTSAIQSVILALINGQRHLPHRDSKLTQLLREAMGSVTCQTCLVVQTTSSAAQHAETLQMLQFTHKVQRLRRRRALVPKGSAISQAWCHDYNGQNVQHSFIGTNPNNTSSEDSSSCDSFALRRATRLRMHMGLRAAVRRSGLSKGIGSRHKPGGTTSSELDYTSSSEQSCDTVIFLGRHNGTDTHLGGARSSRTRMAQIVSGSVPEAQSDHSDNEKQTQHASGVGGDQKSTGSVEHPDLADSKPHTGRTHRRGSVPSADNSGPRGPDVKKTLPRTNAHAWPRAAARNAVEILSTQKEQWIDGPKANFKPVKSSESGTAQPELAVDQTNRPNMVDKVCTNCSVLALKHCTACYK